MFICSFIFLLLFLLFVLHGIPRAPYKEGSEVVIGEEGIEKRKTHKKEEGTRMGEKNECGNLIKGEKDTIREGKV